MYGTGAAIFSVLLVITGAAKVRRPHDVTRAMGALGLPAPAWSGALLGVSEMLIGGGALLMDELLFAQAVLYAGFAGWLWVALRRGVPIASCGCLGRDDTPPTPAHLVMNLLAVALSVGASLQGRVVVLDGLGAVAQAAVIAAGVFLAYIVLTDGARLAGVRGR